jgi:hypothetical protein
LLQFSSTCATIPPLQQEFGLQMFGNEVLHPVTGA